MTVFHRMLIRVGIVFGSFCLVVDAPHGNAQPKKAAFVQVQPVVEQEVRAGQTYVGTIRPTRTSVVGSAVDGRVVIFPVKAGEMVEAGKPLAKLRTGTLELERDSAKAQHDIHLSELAELQAGYLPEEKEQARARFAAADAQRKFARSRRDRLQKLYSSASRSVTEEELQEAISACDRAEQLYLEAQAGLELMKKGPRKEKIDQAMARAASQKAIVDKLNDQIELHTIKMPFTGYVTQEHCEVGQWLNKGAAVVEVIELENVDIEVGVLEEVVNRLKIGDSARVEVPAVQDQAFTGQIVHIVPQANPRSRTFPVKIRVKNVVRDQIPLLKSNMLARVTLGVGQPEKSLMVSKDAIVLGGPMGPIVYTLKPDANDPQVQTAAPVPVQLGIAVGERFQVKGPLTVGQPVVILGNERLFPGQPVSVVKTAP